MRLRFVRPHKSITGPVSTEEIADFVVLSGPNGAGKSNLLEAIVEGATAVEGLVVPDIRVRNDQNSPVRLFTLGQLAPPADRGGSETVGAYYHSWAGFARQVEQCIEEIDRTTVQLVKPDAASLESAVVDRLKQMGYSTGSLQSITEQAGKPLTDFDKADFQRWAPLIPGRLNPFSVTISQLFLSYQARYERNELAQARKEKGRPGGEAALSDDEFTEVYGAPPWDLLNEILESIGLEYRVNQLTPGQEHLPFDVRLIHVPSGTPIELSQLSSGEKTLMAVAMSFYAGSYLSETIELPKVLLLDEPDASLHPAMARDLLRVVHDIFHERYNVKVILATHSPSTVALAPEESLYVIRRSGEPRLWRAASRDEALAALTVGLPALSVRNDNRRQVFVESEDDENCYNEFFRLLKDRLGAPFSLHFIASGKGGQGNREAVIRLVRMLRQSGNAVQGLVDRDERQGAPDGIAFLETRRALENLALDPFLLAVFLLREHVVQSEAIAGTSVAHFQLSAKHAQVMSDYVTARVCASADDNTPVIVDYLSGFQLSIPKFYLNIDGHELEARILDAFQPLKRHRGLKLAVVSHVLTDNPTYAPMDVVDLFNRLGAAAN